MASFDDHITQAKRNIEFLGSVNKTYTSYWDWQTTIAYYTAVHLVNAHIASKANLHYRTHEEVSIVLNPFNKLSPCALPEGIYTAYINLQWLSRRSRYLINDKRGGNDADAFFTSDRHFSKAIRHLDILLVFIKNTYAISFDKTYLLCDRLKADALINFEISK